MEESKLMSSNKWIVAEEGGSSCLRLYVGDKSYIQVPLDDNVSGKAIAEKIRRLYRMILQDGEDR